jgi:flagellar basal-body rod protein FlgG
MVAAFAVLALAQLASIQLMLLANRGGAEAAATFEPIEIQIADARGNITASQQALDNEFEMTGNPFDWAIDGHGYFQIELEDGTTAFTRDASFRTNAQGDVVTQDGFRLLDGLVLPPDFVDVLVRYTGAVSITNADGTITDVGQIQLARFMNPDGLQQWRSKGIYLETEESGVPFTAMPGSDGMGTIEQGLRPVEPFAQAGGITVRIAPGQAPSITGADNADDPYESFRTSKVYP